MRGNASCSSAHREALPRFTKEAATRYFAARGLRTGDDPYHGLHVRDPDRNYVQVSQQR